MTTEDRMMLARLTVASNDRLGRYIERRRARVYPTWRTDFTTPDFTHPEAS